MGSEMCIRDSDAGDAALLEHLHPRAGQPRDGAGDDARRFGDCLLYTSDAADERSSVDLGGRRIIKKKK